MKLHCFCPVCVFGVLTRLMYVQGFKGEMEESMFFHPFFVRRFKLACIVEGSRDGYV